MKKLELTGKKFGRLTVLHEVEDKRRSTYWLCSCECGSQKVICGCSLTRGHTFSCGCYKKDRGIEANTTHGHARMGTSTPTYKTWQSMKYRCMLPTDPSYKDYGGRGISVCERWATSFENFLLDMGERPAGTTLDRIDNESGYSVENCRWATIKEQMNNTSKNRFVTYRGTRLTISQLAEQVGMKPTALHRRISLGWDIEDAVTLPFQANGGKLRRRAA